MFEAELLSWLETKASIAFTRSSGPGGQNVNKVSTAVVLHAAISEIAGLSDIERAIIREKLTNRINNDDQLVVQVQDTRSQWHNRTLAIERTFALLTRALHRDKPRRATKPTRASKERRLDVKSRVAKTKQQRRTTHDD